MKKRMLQLLLGLCLLFNPVLPAAAQNVPEAMAENGAEQANEKLKELTDKKDVFALVYLCEEYQVKGSPRKDAETVAEIRSGQQVRIKEAVFTDEKIWYLTEFFIGGQSCEGFIEREFLAYSDEAFLAWEKESFPVTYQENPAAEYQNEIGQFPESYQQRLSELKKKHPNWTFVKLNTGLNWNTVVAEEMKDARSLVPSSSPDSWKNGNFGSGWSYASEGALKYHLDPRNFLNEEYIFQFEQLTFNPSYHTKEAVQKFLNSTFMAGQIPGEGMTYADAFWKIGNELGVSPFHLASRVYQEQGKGTSALISGTYPGYEGLYNYYNISASGSTVEQIYKNGLERARKEGWTTRYSSLKGGAAIISKSYILKGQDTLYLQKFDVDEGPNGLYWHQYMQNICAPSSEGASIRKLYAGVNSLDNTFVFKIPVYNKMPSAPCAIEPGELEYYAPVFDAAYYANRYPDLNKVYRNDAKKLLEHFVDHGMAEGRQGNEEFNVRIYQANYADLFKVYGTNLKNYYLHYINAGKAEGRNAKTLKDNTGLTIYDGKDYRAVFNAQFYAERNQDLKKVFGNNQEKLLAHFVQHGMSEGRQGNEEFNVKIYKANYADLRSVFGNRLGQYYLHYMNAGKAEGRNAKTMRDPADITIYQGCDYKDVFDAKYYMERYADLRNVYGNDAEKLLEHFVLHGMQEGRQGSEEFNVHVYREKYTDLRNVYKDRLQQYYLHYMNAGKAEGRTAV